MKLYELVEKLEAFGEVGETTTLNESVDTTTNFWGDFWESPEKDLTESFDADELEFYAQKVSDDLYKNEDDDRFNDFLDSVLADAGVMNIGELEVDDLKKISNFADSLNEETLAEDFWNPGKEFIEFEELLGTEFDESGWNKWNQEERDAFAEQVARRYLEMNPTPTPMFYDDLTDNNFHTYRKAFEKLLVDEELTEDKDLSTVKGSMTQILQDNKDKIDSCTTPQEVHDVVAGLLAEADLDTPATRRLLMTLKKQRNIVGALQAVYNSILKGSDLGVIK